MSLELKVNSYNSCVNHKIKIESSDISVKEFKNEISKIQNLKDDLEFSILKLGDLILDDKKPIKEYNIKQSDCIFLLKDYDAQRDTGIKLTKDSDSISGDDNGTFRGVLSCGHPADPTSLTLYCKTLLENGNIEFRCPAIVEGNKCKKIIEFEEIIKIALLTQSEIEWFERKLNENFINSNKNIKQCSRCNSFIERTDMTTLKVRCLICKKDEPYFCWQCEEPWPKVQKDSPITCGSFKCNNQNLEILANCILISPSDDKRFIFPSIRACINCGKLLEHNSTGCKNIKCDFCEKEFCFNCLRLKIDCQRPGSMCNIAPKQTTITSIL